MKILIDIGHPAHVHLFKNFAQEFQKKGHEILFTVRDKEFEQYLLSYYNFNFVSFGKKYESKFGKVLGLIKFDIRELFEAFKFKPDLFISHGSMYASHAAFLLRKPHISLEDTGNLEQIRFYLPFTKIVLTPSVLKKNLGMKQIRYSGYHELAYLHPNRYKPDEKIYQYLNISKDTPFALLRFVNWKATHDYGQKGLSIQLKREILELLSGEMRVYVSSEGALKKEFQDFHIPFPPEKIHDALYFATIYVGEGATMASEAGVLGTPSIYVNSIEACNNSDQEKYGLVYNYNGEGSIIERVKQILNIPNLKGEWQRRRMRMLEDKINVTAFMVWFVENYPESVEIMKKNPEYQYNFK